MRVRPISSHRRSLLEAHARRMRHATTPSEGALFGALRGKKAGVQFRWQALVCGYIVDFSAAELRLVVEVDGAYYMRRRAADTRRDRTLEAAGYRVVRVQAESVVRDVSGVVQIIADVVEELSRG